MFVIFRSFVLSLLFFLLMTTVYASEYVDYTDIWVDTNPPVNSGMAGFGINFIQSGNSFDYIFATFFIYDPATGNPVWVTGDLEREKGKTSFAGYLNQTQGEPTSNPFTPRNTVTMRIGSFTFTPTSSTTGKLAYTVNNTTTTLELKRLSLTENILDSTYWGGATIKRTGCSSSGNNKTTRNEILLDVTKKTGSTQATYTFSIENYSCIMKGTLIQEGRFQRIKNADYVCHLGSDKIVDGSSNIFNITATTQGIEGEWTSNKGLDNCREEGHFAAVLSP